MSSILSSVKPEEEKNAKKMLNRDYSAGLPKQNSINVASPSTPNLPVMPRGCRPLTHQVAGHRYGKGRLGIGMLQHVDGSILKPVQPPPRGAREVNFYKKLFDASSGDPVLLTLRPFLPKFLGIWTPPSVSPTSENDKISPAYSYVKLEDACRRFRNPSILDIKIGRVSYDPEADEKKKLLESVKYPPLAEVGFQLLGMRISGQSPNETVFYGKEYGSSLTKNKITDGLNLYLSGNIAWKKYIVKAFVQRLEMILSWFESQERYQFYSSSLLLIYEGEFMDGSSDSDEEFIHKYRQMQIPSMHNDSYLATVRRFLNKNVEEDRKNESSEQSSATTGVYSVESNRSSQNPTNQQTSTGQESGYSSEAESKKLSNRQASETVQQEFVTSLNRRIQESSLDRQKYRFPPDIVDVRMIDFAHVFEESKTDENYIFGLRNLISSFKQILKTL